MLSNILLKASLMVSLLLISSLAGAQDVVVNDPVPAGYARHSVSYACAASAKPAADVELTYVNSKGKDGISAGLIDRLSFSGLASNDQDLKQINQAVSGRVVESVLVTCNGKQRELMIELLNTKAREAKTTWLTVSRDDGGHLSVRQN